MIALSENAKIVADIPIQGIVGGLSSSIVVPAIAVINPRVKATTICVITDYCFAILDS
jgi:hypothetical protein